MDTSAKNQYIGITNTMQGLKNIYLLRDGARCKKLRVQVSIKIKKGKICDEFLFPSQKKLGVHVHPVHPLRRHPWF